MVFLDLVNSNETISLLMLNMIYEIPISDADNNWYQGNSIKVRMLLI